MVPLSQGVPFLTDVGVAIAKEFAAHLWHTSPENSPRLMRQIGLCCVFHGLSRRT
jgi:hypothetical protein